MDTYRPTINSVALRNLVEGGSEPFGQTYRSYILRCPRCGHDKLYVDKTAGQCKCFHCATPTQPAHRALVDVYRRTPQDLSQILYGIVVVGATVDDGWLDLGDYWDGEQEEKVLDTEIQYPPVIARDPMWIDIAAPEARVGAAYLAGRGVPLEVATQYGIGWSAEEQRVLFPIAVGGLLRGWQGRYIHPTESITTQGRVIRIPKAKTTGKVGGKCFMFQDRLLVSEHAIWTEGPLDCIKCHLLGGNVAGMGKAITQQHLDIILRSGSKKLYIGLDRDAYKEVGRIVEQMSGKMAVYRLLPPDHRDDLGDCTMEEMVEQFRIAQPLGPAHCYQIHIDMPDRWA